MGLPFPHVSRPAVSVETRVSPDAQDLLTRLNAGQPDAMTTVISAIREERLHELPNGGHAHPERIVQACPANYGMHMLPAFEQSTYAHMAAYVCVHDASLPWHPGCERPFHEWSVETVGNCALFSLRGSMEVCATHRTHMDLWRRFTVASFSFRRPHDAE
jgi:hypothetical protein